MLGILYFFSFLGIGVAVAWRLFARLGLQARLMFGCALGYVLMMWMPSLFAFGVRFSELAQVLALGTAALGAAGVYMIPRRAFAPRSAVPEEPPIPLTLALVVPFLLLAGYLQYTHTLRAVDGALFVGQSTYGDLSLHLGIATGLRGASFPPEYTLLPGTTLGYPFLFDALSSSMLLLGTQLSLAFTLPGTIAMGLVFWGFVLFAWELTRNSHAVAIAFLLVFLNGGLGFMYMLDGWPTDSSALNEMMNGYYSTPTNLLSHNLRWVNVICDMLIPQRTLLGGWLMLLPALYMLALAIRTEERFWFVTLGVWAGLMPMVHTHSFLALGLISAGALAASVAGSRARGRLFSSFLMYGALALALALPQLVLWTLPQTIGGKSLRFAFNWVNHNEGGFVDGYFWFWIKNVGPAYVLMVPAALNAPKRVRPLCVGALTLYAVAELCLFQPNEYDNNKLFLVAFLVMMPLVGRLLSAIWDRLHGIRGRALIASVFLAVCLLSGMMTVAREVVSEYQLFGKDETQAAAYVEQHAFSDAVFLTGDQHNNVVASLTGRKIVCGTSIYLFFHGVQYDAQYEAVCTMYERPSESHALFEQYAVDYVYLSSHERGQFSVDEAALRAAYPIWYERDGIIILAVSDRARSQLA